MVMEFMQIYNRLRKRRMSAQGQEDSSFQKKPKTASKHEETTNSNILDEFIKKIRVRQKAMQISESSNLNSSFTQNHSIKDEPYFLRCQSSVKRKGPTTDDTVTNEVSDRRLENEETTTIDMLVEDFRGNFNSPNNSLKRNQKNPNKCNYVKKMVAAFEERYGDQKTATFVPPMKSKLSIPSRCPKSINDTKSVNPRNATIRRSPKVAPTVILDHTKDSLYLKKEESLPKENVIEKKENMIEKKENMIEKKENMIEKKENMIEKKENMIEKKENMIEKKESLIEKTDKLILRTSKLIARTEILISNKEDLISSKENLIAKKENLIVKKENLMVKQEILTEKKEILTEKKKMITEKKDIMTQKRDITTQKRDITTQKRDITTQKRDITTQKNDVMSQKKDITTEKKDIMTEKKDNRSFNSSMETVMIENDKTDHNIDRCWSDVELRSRQIEVLDVRSTRSLDEPIIIGALLKKPVQVDDTRIDWIPLPGQKLPRKRSLRKLISKITGRKKSFKDQNSFTHDSSVVEEKMETLTSKSFIEPTTKPLKRKSWSKSFCQAPKRSKDFCNLPPLRRRRSKDDTPLKEILESNNNYLQAKENPVQTPNPTKMILHEVPRKDLSPDMSYLKVMKTASDYSNQSRKEVVTIKRETDLENTSICDTSMSEFEDKVSSLNTSNMSTFKNPTVSTEKTNGNGSAVKKRKPDPESSNFLETCLGSNDKPYLSEYKLISPVEAPQKKSDQIPNLRKKSLFSPKRPRSDALDEIKSYYRRYERVDSEVRNFIQKMENPPVYSNDIVDTLNKLQLQNVPDDIYKDIKQKYKIRPKSATPTSSIDVNKDKFDSYTTKVKEKYLNRGCSNNIDSKPEPPRNVNQKPNIQFVYKAKIPRHEDHFQNEKKKTNRLSAFFDARMKNANFDSFAKVNANLSKTNQTNQTKGYVYEMPYKCPLITKANPIVPGSRKDVSKEVFPATRSFLSPRPLSDCIENQSHLHAYRLQCNICPNQLCVMRS